jgi:hypothetical protein
MVPYSWTFRAASALTAVGIVLASANWYTRPEAALAWTATLAMFAVMMVALRLSRPAARRSPTEAGAARSLDQIPTAVVFAALMMGIPLALTLARSYGLVDGADLARRSTGVLTGVFIMMLGNVMPKNLPPLSSGCDGGRQQAFHRLAGWTWVLCGLASAVSWLALPIDVAETAAVVLVVTAIAVTIVHLVRLARRARTATPVDSVK